MAKKASKGDVSKNVKKNLVSSPHRLMQDMSGSGLEHTRAVDTFIMENSKEAPLRIQVMRDGRLVTSGTVTWISSTRDEKVVMYLDTKKFLYPSNENVKNALYFPDKKKGGGEIQVEVVPVASTCTVCSKAIEIFDEPAECPVCGAPAHQAHLEEWVRMKGECSKCNARLAVDGNGTVSAA